jgi:hypothetical protein
MSIERRFGLWLFFIACIALGIHLTVLLMSDPRHGRVEISYSELVKISELSRADNREPSFSPPSPADHWAGPFRNPSHPYYWPSVDQDSFGRTVVLLESFALNESRDVYSVIPDEKVSNLQQLLEPLRKYRLSYGIFDATSIAILLPSLVLLCIAVAELRRQTPSAKMDRERIERFTNTILRRSFCSGLGAVLSLLLAILGFCFGSL